MGAIGAILSPPRVVKPDRRPSILRPCSVIHRSTFARTGSHGLRANPLRRAHNNDFSEIRTVLSLEEILRKAGPSRTAERVAQRRAAHQLLDHPAVFPDRLALPILGREARERLLARPGRFENLRFFRAFMAARSRFAEDRLEHAVRRGVRQYVVLGAGLDTFAYRNPFTGLRVFEVDHPQTQQWKRDRLKEAEIAVPPSLRFAPVDFERQTLKEALASAGFDMHQPAFYSWLGVTPYLQPETVLRTLRLVCGMTPYATIVFDYALPRSSLDFRNRLAFDALSRRVASAGEPFRGFFLPNELAAALAGMGFHAVEDLDTAAINRLYFHERADGLRVGGALGRLICAATES